MTSASCDRCPETVEVTSNVGLALGHINVEPPEHLFRYDPPLGPGSHRVTFSWDRGSFDREVDGPADIVVLGAVTLAE